MGVFLALAPIVVMMAWTFLKVGSAIRVEGLREERRIRAFHTAEAALRCFLATGQPASVKLNGCGGSALLQDGKVVAWARPDENEFDGHVRIELELDRGFVIGRNAYEDREEL
jgi:hypothetical protein